MFITIPTKKNGLVLQKNGAGFSLVEMLITISLGMTMAMFLLLTAVNGLKYAKSIQKQERLQAEAAFVSNKLAYWIKQGQELSVLNPSELHIILPDSSEKIFKKEGDDITLDGQSIINDEIQVNELTFIPMTRSVKINLVLAQEQESEIELSITTTLAQRNIF